MTQLKLNLVLSKIPEIRRCFVSKAFKLGGKPTFEFFVPKSVFYLALVTIKNVDEEDQIRLGCSN